MAVANVPSCCRPCRPFGGVELSDLKAAVVVFMSNGSDPCRRGGARRKKRKGKPICRTWFPRRPSYPFQSSLWQYLAAGQWGRCKGDRGSGTPRRWGGVREQDASGRFCRHLLAKFCVAQLSTRSLGQLSFLDTLGGVGKKDGQIVTPLLLTRPGCRSRALGLLSAEELFSQSLKASSVCLCPHSCGYQSV